MVVREERRGHERRGMMSEEFEWYVTATSQDQWIVFAGRQAGAGAGAWFQYCGVGIGTDIDRHCHGHGGDK